MAERKEWAPSDYVRHGWARKSLARNEWGEPCPVASNESDEWCILGAIYASHETNRISEDDIYRVEVEFSKLIGLSSDVQSDQSLLEECITLWNDGNPPDANHREIANMLKSAEQNALSKRR